MCMMTKLDFLFCFPRMLSEVSSLSMTLNVFAESKDQPVGKFRPTFPLFIFNFINKLRLFRLCSCNLNRMIWTSIGLLSIMKYMGDYLMAKGQSEERLCPHFPHGTDSFDCFYKFSSKNYFPFPVLELTRIATRRGLLSNHETNRPVRIPVKHKLSSPLCEFPVPRSFLLPHPKNNNLYLFSSSWTTRLFKSATFVSDEAKKLDVEELFHTEMSDMSPLTAPPEFCKRVHNLQVRLDPMKCFRLIFCF